MSTLTQLISETARLLGDVAGNRWLQAVANPPVLGTNDVQYLLNKMAEEFNLASGVFHAVISVQVVANIPTAVIKDASGNPPYGPLLRLEDQNGKALIRTNEGYLNTTEGENWRSVAPGAPKRYVRGLDDFGTIRLYPPSSSNQTFLAYVTAMPIPMLTGNDLPWIGSGPNKQASPAQYHSALPYGAASVGLMWNQSSLDVALSKEFRAEFDKRAERAASEVKASLEP